MDHDQYSNSYHRQQPESHFFQQAISNGYQTVTQHYGLRQAPASSFSAQEEANNYYRDRGDYPLAAQLQKSYHDGGVVHPDSIMHLGACGRKIYNQSRYGTIHCVSCVILRIPWVLIIQIAIYSYSMF